ncbi:RING finger protein [Pelomyxa schiedti]|nr:RING finger protein [Pelomyxa schiedti]
MPQCYCHVCNKFFDTVIDTSSTTTSTSTATAADATTTTNNNNISSDEDAENVGFRCITCGSDFVEEVDPTDPPVSAQQQPATAQQESPQGRNVNGQQQQPPSHNANANVNASVNGGMPPMFAWGPGAAHFTVHTNMVGQMPEQFYRHMQALFNGVASRHGHAPVVHLNFQQVMFPFGDIDIGPGAVPLASGRPGAVPLPQSGIASDPNNYAWGRNLNDLLHRLFESSQGRGPPPASTSAISTLPTVKIQQKHIDDKEECNVCKDDFQLDEEVVMLPCKHLYHQDCIKPWLNMHNTCPSCRFELPTDDADYERNKSQQQRH